MADILDLDAEQEQRLARREGRAENLPVRFRGKVIAVLPPEFGLDVLEPLLGINLDLALLVRQAIDVMQAEGGDQQAAAFGMIVDILASNPDLPREVLTALGKAGRRLLGDDGYDKFMAASPSPWDVAALVRGIADWYGIGLGESSPSDDSLDGGATSNTTSSAISGSTPAEPGAPTVNPDSSASAAS